MRKLFRSNEFSTWVFISLETLFKFYSYARSLPAQFDSDSASYRSGNGFTNWGWVSLSGEDYGRGWPVIALYSLVKEDDGRVFIQSLVGLVSWIVLALACGSKIRNIKKRAAFFVSIFIFSNLSVTQNYDNFIGRESITLSLILFSISFCVYLQTTKNLTFLYLILITTVLFSINKPTMIFIALLEWAIILNFIFWNSRLQKKNILHLTFISLAILYTFLNVSNQNDGWRKSDPTTRSQSMINFTYTISEFNPEAAKLKTFFANNGAPLCALSKKSKALTNLGEPMEDAALFLKSCEGFDSWVTEKFRGTYLKFILLNPLYAKEVVGSQLLDAFKVYPAGTSLSILPNISNQIILGLPLFEYWILVSFLITLVWIIRRLKGKSSLNSEVKFSLSLGIAFLCSVLFSLLIQPTHASDISRQNFVSQILIRLIIVTTPFFLTFRKRAQNVN